MDQSSSPAQQLREQMDQLAALNQQLLTQERQNNGNAQTTTQAQVTAQNQAQTQQAQQAQQMQQSQAQAQLQTQMQMQTQAQMAAMQNPGFLGMNRFGYGANSFNASLYGMSAPWSLSPWSGGMQPLLPPLSAWAAPGTPYGAYGGGMGAFAGMGGWNGFGTASLFGAGMLGGYNPSLYQNFQQDPLMMGQGIMSGMLGGIGTAARFGAAAMPWLTGSLVGGALVGLPFAAVGAGVNSIANNLRNIGSDQSYWTQAGQQVMAPSTSTAWRGLGMTLGQEQQMGTFQNNSAANNWLNTSQMNTLVSGMVTNQMLLGAHNIPQTEKQITQMAQIAKQVVEMYGTTMSGAVDLLTTMSQMGISPSQMTQVSAQMSVVASQNGMTPGAYASAVLPVAQATAQETGASGKATLSQLNSAAMIVGTMKRQDINKPGQSQVYSYLSAGNTAQVAQSFVQTEQSLYNNPKMQGMQPTLAGLFHFNPNTSAQWTVNSAALAQAAKGHTTLAQLVQSGTQTLSSPNAQASAEAGLLQNAMANLSGPQAAQLAQVTLQAVATATAGHTLAPSVAIPLAEKQMGIAPGMLIPFEQYIQTQATQGGALNNTLMGKSMDVAYRATQLANWHSPQSYIGHWTAQARNAISAPFNWVGNQVADLGNTMMKAIIGGQPPTYNPFTPNTTDYANWSGFTVSSRAEGQQTQNWQTQASALALTNPAAVNTLIAALNRSGTPSPSLSITTHFLGERGGRLQTRPTSALSGSMGYWSIPTLPRTIGTQTPQGKAPLLTYATYRGQLKLAQQGQLSPTTSAQYATWLSHGNANGVPLTALDQQMLSSLLEAGSGQSLSGPVHPTLFNSSFQTVWHTLTTGSNQTALGSEVARISRALQSGQGVTPNQGWTRSRLENQRRALSHNMLTASHQYVQADTSFNRVLARAGLAAGRSGNAAGLSAYQTLSAAVAAGNWTKAEGAATTASRLLHTQGLVSATESLKRAAETRKNLTALGSRGTALDSQVLNAMGATNQGAQVLGTLLRNQANGSSLFASTLGTLGKEETQYKKGTLSVSGVEAFHKSLQTSLTSDLNNLSGTQVTSLLTKLGVKAPGALTKNGTYNNASVAQDILQQAVSQQTGAGHGGATDVTGKVNKGFKDVGTSLQTLGDQIVAGLSGENAQIQALAQKISQVNNGGSTVGLGGGGTSRVAVVAPSKAAAQHSGPVNSSANWLENLWNSL